MKSSTKIYVAAALTAGLALTGCSVSNRGMEPASVSTYWFTDTVRRPTDPKADYAVEIKLTPDKVALLRRAEDKLKSVEKQMPPRILKTNANVSFLARSIERVITAKDIKIGDPRDPHRFDKGEAFIDMITCRNRITDTVVASLEGTGAYSLSGQLYSAIRDIDNASGYTKTAIEDQKHIDYANMHLSKVGDKVE
jgi:hypothetical protein